MYLRTDNRLCRESEVKMALSELKFFSESLHMQTSVYAIIPQRKTNGEIGVHSKTQLQDYKCLYLLHGLSDDNSIWLRRTSIERYAQEYGICVIMPSAARSFYTDMKYGEKYYTYIAKELPAVIREFFHVSGKREDNYIAGLSMGGYGALKIGMRECANFCAAAGLSSVADIAGRSKSFGNTLIPIFGDDLEIPDEEDLFYLAKKFNSDPQKPRIYMCVGTEDFLYEDNIKLKSLFESLDYDFTYREAKGTHCWEFWDEQIKHVLEWMLK